ncbi:MAG TPA: sulfatase/phosphatase domain-containing protein [Acidobacteriaceae bacterium]|nr:sulfatase/phosphatase domain-containing protein [Acidobacteriaceae bacterium]
MFDKRLMHEPLIRVPLMVRYPKRIPPGTVRDEMILDIDLTPTFLDLAGLSCSTLFHCMCEGTCIQRLQAAVTNSQELEVLGLEGFGG